MASILLRTAGTAAGNAIAPGIGGAFFGALGRSAGGIIDGKLGFGTHIEGPRLENLSVHDSRYGAGIPIVYGRMRIAGNVIWSSDLIEARHDTSYGGGKGGGSSSASSTSYTYSVHAAIGLCLGPIGTVQTIWADSTVIYENGQWSSSLLDSLTIYTGTETQTPDTFMESMIGAGSVPAWRGLAYVVLENLQLADFGNRLPNLTFEITPLDDSSSIPEGLGTYDASVMQFTPSIANATMPPWVTHKSSTGATQIVIGGYNGLTSSRQFTAVTYDTTGTIPVEDSRTSSTTFTQSSPFDNASALSPNRRYIAFLLVGSGAPTHHLALYDTLNDTFGDILSLTLSATLPITTLGWLDNHRFVFLETNGGDLGVHVIQRAGSNLLDMGFISVWGSGSSSTHQAFYGAQFAIIPSGLVMITTNVTVSPYFTEIYGCSLSWQQGGLSVGTPYTIASGLYPVRSGSVCATVLATGSDEITFCLSTTTYFALMSCSIGLSSSSITRPWQSFPISFTHGTTNAPVYYGDRLVIVQRHAYENLYRLSDILLESTSFTLSRDAVQAVNSAPSTTNFNATRLDNTRILVVNSTGFDVNLGQIETITRGLTGQTLPTIIADLLDRAGYNSTDYDVSQLSGTVDGYVVQVPCTVRAAIEPLQVYIPFDLVESDGVLVARPRHSDFDATLDPTTFSATDEAEDSIPRLSYNRAQEQDIPNEISLDFIDASRSFEINSSRAKRLSGHARAVQKIALPLVMTASDAKQVAETRLYMMWAEREMIRWTMPRDGYLLDAGDVVDIGLSSPVHLTRIKQNRGVVSCEAFPILSTTLTADSEGESGLSTVNSLASIIPTSLFMMDLPLLQTADDQAGIYYALSGSDGWHGGTLWRSYDGVDYAVISQQNKAATAGTALTALPDGTADYIDRALSLQVQLIRGTLSSCTMDALLSGANVLCVGQEILQFQTATLEGDGLYTLTNLLRGRRGTDYALSSHTVGEDVVLLEAGTVSFIPLNLSERNQTVFCRALSQGQTLGLVPDSLVTYSMNTVRPLSPVHVVATRTSGTGSDTTFSWIRRARKNAFWQDDCDVPLDEDEEIYEIDILNGSTLLRTMTINGTSSVTYTAAEQTSDWGGSVPTQFDIIVYQRSARTGRGHGISATV